MENNKLCTDQVPTSVQGSPANGISIPNKVFAGQSSPAPVACHAGTLSSGSTEVSSSTVPLRSRAETSEFSLTSTPSAAQTGGATPSCSTPCSTPMNHDRKTLYSRNTTSVDRRSNELRSSMKSPSVVSGCSPATLNNGNHGSSGNHGPNLSPGNQSNGNRSTGVSTCDSIFTYSLTDESHDELDDVDAKRDRENEAKQKTLDFSDDAKTADLKDESNIPVPCDNNNFVDKIKQVKNVIQKEYVHTITYTFDELTSFEKHLDSINAKSELCQSSNDEQLQQKLKKTPKASSSADHRDFGHKKFSSRTVKNFLRSMSPASRHRKPSKSSESLSSRSSNTLAGSLDSASVGEEPEETGAACKTTPKTDASRKKSPGIAKKSPDSHSSHGQKSKAMICDPVTKNSNAGEANLSSDCQVGGK